MGTKGQVMKTWGLRILGIALVFLLITNSVYSQANKLITAYNYYQDKDYVKARENIEPATSHEKTRDAAKTWYYRGMIYEAMYFDKNNDYDISQSAIIHTASKSYQKAFEFDTRRIDQNDLKRRMVRCANVEFSEGVNAYNERDYTKAKELFSNVVNAKASASETDSLAIFNVALAAENLSDAATAIAHYRKCIDIGYSAEQCYSNIAYLYNLTGETDKQKEVLNEGLEKFPGSQPLLTSMINYYLANGQGSRALQYLNNLIAKDPSNEILYFARGTIYQKQENYPKALPDFKKAIELKPDYFDAQYNLGALFFNLGADATNLASNSDDEVEYQKLKANADHLFEKATIYLEKAHELDPNNVNVMNSLLQVYLRNENMEKYKEMKNKLGN